MIPNTEIEIRQKLKDDFMHYAMKCLKIRSKSGHVISFVLNDAQRYIHNKLQEQKNRLGFVRAIILKGRQQGASTYIDGRHFHIVTHNKGYRAFILTHEQEATNNLFEMVQRYYENCPALVKPISGAHNAKEFYFQALDSGYKVGTAGNKSVGRSSTIQLFHGSEVAFWPNAEEHAKGILQAIGREQGTEIIEESTANGMGNYFHERWQLAQKGEIDSIPIFVPWFWQPEYKITAPDGFVITDEENELKKLYNLSNDQILWRRQKINDLPEKERGFKQEYPCTPSEAFQSTGDESYIQPADVMRARKTPMPSNIGSLTIGVDPARFGDDRTAFIRRRGRSAFKLETFKKLDTMQIAGKVVDIIKKEQPQMICVDVGGLGAGVVDRLNEMGYSNIVKGVNSGTSSIYPDRYSNKKAEMWGQMKEWLLDAPCHLEDSDELHMDLCAPLYSYDSKNRLVIEKKEEMKRRGFKSTDCADALALTFGFPTNQNSVNINSLINKTFKL